MSKVIKAALVAAAIVFTAGAATVGFGVTLTQLTFVATDAHKLVKYTRTDIKADKNGKVNTIMYDSIIKLSGKYSIIGRSVVIHEKKDDLGRGNNKESLITGNAGKRIGCGVIGLTGNC